MLPLRRAALRYAALSKAGRFCIKSVFFTSIHEMNLCKKVDIQCFFRNSI